jgi:hypothetical protein
MLARSILHSVPSRAIARQTFRQTTTVRITRFKGAIGLDGIGQLLSKDI